MAAAVASPAPPTLRGRMRAGSRGEHSLSDAMVNARLIALFTDRTLYGKALGCFYLVHKQLDACLQKSESHNSIQKMAASLQPLYRTQGFEKDLQYYLGDTWEEQLVASPPIQAYQEHLESLAANNPGLLLSHSYTQHLAMLSGGQIIKGLARKGMKLPEGQGTAAFEYEGRVGALRSAYIDALDGLGKEMDEEQVQQMVEETKRAFGFNNAIIREFRMGFLAPIKAALQLTPVAVWAGLAAAAAGVAALGARLGAGASSAR